MKGIAVSQEKNLYVGVDVGGTKILAALTTSRGEILARERTSTPREGGPGEIVGVIERLIWDLLNKNGIPARSLGAIGLAVPGVVDSEGRKVIFAPNLDISGLDLTGPLEKEFHAPACLGNDVNVGTLGEKWIGAARSARSAVGIFVGTGIGGGIILDGRLLTGYHGSAGELGHMIMQIGGPRCGCGGRGCLEALASRTAIERDLRAAMAEGRKTVLADLVESRSKPIRSSVLQEALQKKDKVVTEVMQRASEVIGQACVTIRHILDPEVIVLGGGVVEACGWFILPIVQGIVEGDTLLAKVSKGKVVASELGDDAVALGAVAMAQQFLGRNPFKLSPPTLLCPLISKVGPGQITVGGETYEEDVVIRADCKVKKRRKIVAKVGGEEDQIVVAELEKICKGTPASLIVGAGMKKMVQLGLGPQSWLAKRNIRVEVLPTPKAVEVYNRTKGRKAAWLRVSA
jgi:glucokinase